MDCLCNCGTKWLNDNGVFARDWLNYNGVLAKYWLNSQDVFSNHMIYMDYVKAFVIPAPSRNPGWQRCLATIGDGCLDLSRHRAIDTRFLHFMTHHINRTF